MIPKPGRRPATRRVSRFVATLLNRPIARDSGTRPSSHASMRAVERDSPSRPRRHDLARVHAPIMQRTPASRTTTNIAGKAVDLGVVIGSVSAPPELLVTRLG